MPTAAERDRADVIFESAEANANRCRKGRAAIRLTDAQGRIDFDGFYGEYEVTLKQPGKRHLTHRLHQGEKTENQWTLSVD